jgi:hypothetical protein
MKPRTLSPLIVAALACGCARKETTLYEGELEPTELRYTVHATGSGSAIPGGSSGGPGVVRVLDRNGHVILERKMKSTLSDIMYSNGQLIIAGQEAIDLPKIQK